MPTRTRSTRALLAAFAALGGFLSYAQAQSVATAPVGAVTKTVPVGLSTLGIALTNPDLVVGACSANTTGSLTLSGVSNVGALLTAGLPYYVEAISGDLEGERFDVNVADTITAASGTVVIQASANNTFALTADVAVGSQFALRKHITLSQVQSMFTAPLVSSTTASNADQIRLFNPQTGAFLTYSLRNQTTWVFGSANSNNVAIPPGTGILFRKLTSPATLVTTGGVRTNDFAMPMEVGLSFRSLPYPISYSPVDLGASTTTGWTASTTVNNADQIRIFNATTGAFVTNSLRTGSTWVQGSTNVSNTDIIAYDDAFLLSRKAADNNYILVSPVAL